MAARKFALVSPNYHPLTCGVGDYSMRLAEELQRRGFECSIFTRAPAQINPEGPTVPVFGHEGPTPLVIAERISRALSAFGATDLILQYTPQMFGAWRWGSAATVWLVQRARAMGMKVTVLAHELYLNWAARPDLALAAGMMRVQLAALMKTADRFLVTVEQRAKELEGMTRLLCLPSPGVVRIGSPALPRLRERNPGGTRIGVFTTLAANKRFDVVLDCFRLVQRRHPEAELYILGDLGDPNDRRLRAFLASIDGGPAKQNIRVPGKRPLADIAQMISTLDIYLFPMSTGANTRSSTLPLALGSGVPVVAFRGSQTDDLFVDEQNVLFASSLSADSFATAALRIIDDPALASRLSSGGAQLYSQHLSWDRIGDQFLGQL